jgi:hypothetical protein
MQKRRGKKMFFLCLSRDKKLEGRFYLSPITKVTGYLAPKNTEHPKLTNRFNSNKQYKLEEKSS